MFAAGGIAWLNLRDDVMGYEEERVVGQNPEWHRFEDRYCGWPFCWHVRNAKIEPMHIEWTPFAEDSAIGIAILMFVALIMESIIRAAERRKQ